MQDRTPDPVARASGHPFPPHGADGLVGASFKPEHFSAIRDDAPHGLFFEIHAENYMGAGGMPHAALTAIRQNYPVSLHGVAMSIGGPDPLDRDHLARFAALVRRYQPALVSEHLAWSSHDDIYTNDLLPLPYTDATLARVCDHIDEMQNAIGRTILLENPSAYLAFAETTWMETDFLDEIARRTGCGLLLDVNNVFISATNHGTSPDAYLAAFPLHRVGEIHLAGHDTQSDDAGAPLLIDSHDRPVADPVWDLYASVIARTGPVATLIEWDTDVPDWPVLKSEAERARAVMASIAGRLRHVA